MKAKVLFIAAAATVFAVACNNNKAAEAEATAEDLVAPVEEAVTEDIPDMIDTVVANAEKAVTTTTKKAANTVKEEVKKEAGKVVENIDGSKTVNTEVRTRGNASKTETTVTENKDGSTTVNAPVRTRKRN